MKQQSLAASGFEKYQKIGEFVVLQRLENLRRSLVQFSPITGRTLNYGFIVSR